MPAPAAPTTFLVRYGEIGIKSLPVRRRFEFLLARNIQRSLAARGAAGEVRHTWGRLFLIAPEAAGREVLARTFGVVSFSPVVAAPVALESLAAFVGEQAAVIPPRSTFAIRARRQGEVGYTSQDLARAAGQAVLDRHRSRGLSVDLSAPQAEILVEVREGEAWVAFESLPGPGGLPVASEGRVSAWLGGPRDALAAWMAMKRGCRVDLLAPPGAAGEDLAKRLAAFDAGMELTHVDADSADRPLVLALLEAHAHRRKGSAVVVGDGFAEAMALAPLDRGVAVPVFRPLLALEPAMVARAAEALGVAPEPVPPTEARPPGDPAALRLKAREMLRGAQRAKVAP